MCNEKKIISMFRSDVAIGYVRDGIQFLPVDYDAWDDDDIAELIEEIFN